MCGEHEAGDVSAIRHIKKNVKSVARLFKERSAAFQCQTRHDHRVHKATMLIRPWKRPFTVALCVISFVKPRRSMEWLSWVHDSDLCFLYFSFVFILVTFFYDISTSFLINHVPRFISCSFLMDFFFLMDASDLFIVFISLSLYFLPMLVLFVFIF